MHLRTYIPIVVRVLLGGLFAFSGTNKLIPFMELPAMPEPATALLGALAATGYFFPLLGLTEVVAGALLIAGRFVPLALVVLAPLVVNIAFFHLLLAPDPASVVLIVGAEIYLAWVYREAFSRVLAATSEPPVRTAARVPAREAIASSGGGR